MSIELVKKEIDIGKETSEILELVCAVIEDIKEKKDIQEIAIGNLSKLSNALSGIDKLDEEIKHESVFDTMSYGLGKLAKCLLKKAPTGE